MPYSSSLPSPDARAAAADLDIREAIALIDNAIEDISPKAARARQNTHDERLGKAARRRTYTILAIAGLAGFLSAAIRRR